MNSSQKAEKRVRHALHSLLSAQPFFGTLALRLPLRADATRVSIATDGENLFFNEDWILESRSDEIKSAIARLVISCSLKHHTRREDRDYETWQEASRQVTIPILRDSGLLPDGINETGMDVSIERAYEMLAAEMPPEADAYGEHQDGDGSDGGDHAAQTAVDAPQGAGTDDDGGSTPDTGDAHQGASQGDTGADGGGDAAGTPASADPTGAGEVMDAPAGASEAEMQERETDWDEALHQAFSTSKAAGIVPGSISELVEKIHNHPLPWRDILSEFMRSNARDDFTWSRPNSRYASAGLYLPSLLSTGMGPIAFLIDTSGSMDSYALANVWAQIRDACAELRPAHVTVIQGDTSVNNVTEYDVDDLPERLDIRGRGGTSFIPLLRELNNVDVPFDCAVYFTDGGTAEGEERGKREQPDCPVLWALTDDFWTPWFGQAVHIPQG